MGFSDFFGSSVLAAAVLAAVPLLVIATGELTMELSGTLNLALAGLVNAGSATAGTVTYVLGNRGIDLLWGILSSVVIGVVLGVAFAYVTVTLRVHQVTAGLAMFILTSGLGALIYRLGIGVTSRAVQFETLPQLRIPGLANIPYIGKILFSHNLYTYIAVPAIGILLWLLYRSNWGLRLRASGENPRAVDGVGVDVFRVRYISIVIGSTLASLGGAYLSLVLTGSYSPESAIEQGWIALVLVIFGQWRPIPLCLGVALFGYIEALTPELTLKLSSVSSALFLMLPFVLALAVLVATFRRAVEPRSLAKTYEREVRF
ncbi:MAG: ABC transporter permease [Acidothermus cellulolyticus]|nr:ABC transporter permease [Acidothermus cellulolyticus]